MSREEKSILVDQEVPALLTSLMKEAQEYILVVTPYIDIAKWGHMKQALESAIKRGVKASFLIRSDARGFDDKASASIKWLLDNHVAVDLVERLHAKIYMNEKTTVISSMNLLETSANDSLEIAIIVRDQEQARRVRHYVQYLKGLGLLVGKNASEPGAPTAQPTEVRRAMPRLGICIRCGRQLPLDPYHPLCDPCYDEWAQWGNKDYEENYCHICGRASPTTYAEPLCRNCDQQVR